MIVNREKYIKKIRPFYDVDLIKVLVGSRRSGKSKVLELIMNELRQKGIDQEHLIYINFEDLAFDFIKDYKMLYDYIVSHIGKGRYYIFIDEIQEIKNFEKT